MWLSLCSDNHSVRGKKLKVLCRFLLQEPGPSALWVSFSLQNMSLLLLVQWSMHVTSSVEIQEWKPTVKASTSIPQRLSWELNPATLITTWPAPWLFWRKLSVYKQNKNSPPSSPFLTQASTLSQGYFMNKMNMYRRPPKQLPRWSGSKNCHIFQKLHHDERQHKLQRVGLNAHGESRALVQILLRMLS